MTELIKTKYQGLIGRDLEASEETVFMGPVLLAYFYSHNINLCEENILLCLFTCVPVYVHLHISHELTE